MPGRLAAALIAGLLPVLLLACAGCEKEEPAPPPRAAVGGSLLARAPAPSFTAEEERILSLLEAYYRDLTRALRSPLARSLDADEAAAAIKRFSDPALDRFATVTPLYRALGEERQEMLQHAFVFRNVELLQAFIRAVAYWTEQFRPGARAHAFRPILRQVLRQWHERDALWVYALWSDEAVEEIIEWTLSEDEVRAWRLRRLEEIGGHPEIDPKGKPISVTLQSDCQSCH